MPDLRKADDTRSHYAQGCGVPRIAYLSMSLLRRRADNRTGIGHQLAASFFMMLAFLVQFSVLAGFDPQWLIGDLE
jgi:hypothetical protein